MNTYLKIVLALSLLILITPVKSTCNYDHFCGNYLHCEGVIPALVITTSWLFWKMTAASSREIEAGWNSPDKEGFFRSVIGTSLDGLCILGAAKLLFCFDGEQHRQFRACNDGDLYSNSFTYMEAGAIMGGIFGLGKWILYNTPEHSIKRAEELSNIPDYQESHINTGTLLLHNEKKFWNAVEATYCTHKYPLVSINCTYEVIEMRLSRIIQYLDKATQNGASAAQLIATEGLRERTMDKLAIVKMVLVAVKRHPNYYNQVQANTQDKIAATQEKMLAEQRWNNIQQACNSWK